MRILFIHSIGKKKFGGGEKWLITAAAGLRDNGHEVFVGGRPGSRLLRAASAEGIDTVTFNILSDLSIYYMFRIASFIRTHKIDVVITRGRELAIAGVAAGMGGNPLVLVRHGLPLRSGFRKHIFLLNRLADGIIANTKTIKDLYEQKGWVDRDFTRVIYNGAVTETNFTPYDYSSRFPGKKVILTIGRLARQKGYYYLIDAIAILRESRDDFAVFVLGEGKMYGKLVSYAREKGISDLIHFEGFVENVAPYLMGCDLFVLPSLYEGMSNAAMEAMACGKPVVLTNVDGAGELITDDSKGMLIPPRDPDAIANAVIRLLDDNELRERIGEEARKHIASNFTVSAMIENIQTYIEEMWLAKENQK